MSRAPKPKRTQVESNVRSLVMLHKSGSTSRVLNLLRVYENAQQDNEPIGTPFFSHPVLNRAFVVKHRLRSNEKDIFPDGRLTATKILIPLDFSSLEMGGGYVFIGQPNYLQCLAEAIGGELTRRAKDLQMLEALDKLPSFDPFLLREWLIRYDLSPDSRYFELSLKDIMSMENFVYNEISLLVTMSLSGQARNEAVTRLVKKMLASRYDGDLDPLRETLRLTMPEFREGMFAWKGFLYYKWSAKAIERDIPAVIQEMKDRQPSRGLENETMLALEASRRRLGRLMVLSFNELADRIRTYDNAYKEMTEKSNPLAFKHFLLAAPVLFLQMGDLMGQLQHVVHFWRYRSRMHTVAPMNFDEYAEMMRDFEESLSGRIA